MIVTNVFSAHEHLGFGKLEFENGSHTIYDARGDVLLKSINPLREYLECQKLNCILYPQMPYRKYSKAEEYAIETDVINSNFFEQLNNLPTVYSYYPFVYLRCTDSLTANERIIKEYRERCYGIKIHPDAEMIGTDRIASSGVFELASEYDLPITIHCSRPGGMADYQAIRRDLLDKVVEKGIRFNIAHLGFACHEMLTDTLPEKVFTDLSPMGVILDQYLRSDGTEGAFFSETEAFIHNNSRAVMYGGDFPFDIQKWEDGSIHGNGRMEDIKMLERIISTIDADEKNAIFYDNCFIFLNLPNH